MDLFLPVAVKVVLFFGIKERFRFDIGADLFLSESGGFKFAQFLPVQYNRVYRSAKTER